MQSIYPSSCLKLAIFSHFHLSHRPTDSLTGRMRPLSKRKLKHEISARAAKRSQFSTSSTSSSTNLNNWSTSWIRHGCVSRTLINITYLSPSIWSLSLVSLCVLNFGAREQHQKLLERKEYHFRFGNKPTSKVKHLLIKKNILTDYSITYQPTNQSIYRSIVDHNDK